VHDFFKPRRERFCETPVFDGQYSNRCYQNRMLEALEDFRRRALDAGLMRTGQFSALSDRWARMIFHLPYAFHAKRMYVEAFVQELKAKGTWASEAGKNGWKEPIRSSFPTEKDYDKAVQALLKQVSEGKAYRRLVREKLEKAQWASGDTGNLYTASIFLALMSTLEADVREGSNLKGKRLGFVAYGSGSKSKVFEAVVQPAWASVAAQFNVAGKLAARRAVDYDQYEALHTGRQTEPVYAQNGRWGLERIGQEGVKLGARYYAEFGMGSGE
jgi:hydroxymethylglutaryl-CoA synthase